MRVCQLGVEGVPVEGLEGLSPERLPLLGGVLAGAVEEAARAAGFAFGGEGDGERLLVAPSVSLGPDALRGALERGRAQGSPCRIVLGGQIGELLRALPSAGPALAYLPAGTHSDTVIFGDLIVTEMDPLERLLPMELPGGGDGLPVSDRVIVPIGHWLDLLWANMLGLPAHLWGALLGRPIARAALRGTWAAARAMSVDPARIAAKLVDRGRDVRVHPSAVVEGSVLGRGARVGAGAVVRGAVLGEGARVEEQALAVGVVLGPGAVVQRQAMLKFSVLGPGAMIGGVTQLSVLGAGASLKRGAYGMDQSLEGGVRVMRRGALVDVPLGMAGVCLGEDTVIGCGVRIAPGRAIPARRKVVAGGALTRPDQLGAGEEHSVVREES